MSVPAGLPLERLQRWMQTVVVHPGDVEAGLGSPEARRELPAERISDVLLPSASLSAAERLGIYHGMYLLRMVEALRQDYDALEHFLGDAAFRELVEGYVQAHPSRSFTLNRLGDHLPDYIRTLDALPRREFCHDLARLQLAITEVFDSEETPGLTPEQIAAVPPEAWERARLRPIAAFRLLALRYPANAYLQTVRDDDHDHPAARRKDTWVAVYRRNYAVYRLGLTRPAHDLLADLVAGQPVGDAIGARLRARGRRPAESQLFGWFRDWATGGIFRSVDY